MSLRSMYGMRTFGSRRPTGRQRTLGIEPRTFWLGIKRPKQPILSIQGNKQEVLKRMVTTCTKS